MDYDPAETERKIKREVRQWRRKGFVQIAMSELEELWAALRHQGIWYNGCTHVALKERYGDNVIHVMGYGWMKRRTP